MNHTKYYLHSFFLFGFTPINNREHRNHGPIVLRNGSQHRRPKCQITRYRNHAEYWSFIEKCLLDYSFRLSCTAAGTTSQEKCHHTREVSLERKFMRMLPGLVYFNSEERLNRLELFSLEESRGGLN